MLISLFELGGSRLGSRYFRHIQTRFTKRIFQNHAKKTPPNANYFLAPSGAQEMLIFVRSFVRLRQRALKLTIFIFISQISLSSVSGQSHFSHRPVPGQSLASLRSVSVQSHFSLRSVSVQS